MEGTKFTDIFSAVHSLRGQTLFTHRQWGGILRRWGELSSPRTAIAKVNDAHTMHSVKVSIKSFASFLNH